MSALEQNKRSQLKSVGLGLRYLLGVVFLILQVEEYVHAYQKCEMKL